MPRLSKNVKHTHTFSLRGHTCLRYCATQSKLRNAEINRDGWGVGWYESDHVYPFRYRTAHSIVQGPNNQTVDDFVALIEGHKEVLRCVLMHLSHCYAHVPSRMRACGWC